MGRPKRSDEAGGIYHMLNRANRRETIFHKDVDYEAFENVLLEARWDRFATLQLLSHARSLASRSQVRKSMAKWSGSANGFA